MARSRGAFMPLHESPAARPADGNAVPGGTGVFLVLGDSLLRDPYEVLMTWTKDGFSWSPVDAARGAKGGGAVPITECIGVTAELVGRDLLDACGCSPCIPSLPEGLAALAVHTFERRPKSAVLRPVTRRFAALPAALDPTTAETGLAMCERWAWAARERLALETHRPKRLLVLINPWGGRRRAPTLWRTIVQPILERAGVEVQAVETEFAGHARGILEAASADQLSSLDGAVVVGGDGFFGEVLNALLARRGAGGAAGVAAARLRVGVIPAGSTDTVACSTLGTRDPATAAIHVALGARLPLDVVRIDCQDGTRKYVASFLAYGFYGEIIAHSESLRWLGPSRYDLAGLLAFFSHRQHRGTLSYLPATRGRRPSLCLAGCAVCAGALAEAEALTQAESLAESLTESVTESLSPSLTPETTRKGAAAERGSTPPQGTGAGGGEWVTLDGGFQVVAAAVMPCRCDKAPGGIAPHAHLADGHMDLMIVRACSRLQARLSS